MNKFFSSLLITSTLVWGIAPALSSAETSVAVDLRIQTADGDLFSGWVSVSDGCTVVDTDGVSHELTGTAALCALQAFADQEGKTLTIENSAYGLFLSGIGKHLQDSVQSWYWLFRVNNVSPSVGLDAYTLEDSDELLLTLGAWPSAPVAVSVSSVDILKEDSVTATVTAFDDITHTFLPLAGASIYVGKSEYETYTTDSNGVAIFSVENKGDYNVFATKTDYSTSEVSHLRVRAKNTSSEFVDRATRQKFLTSALNWLTGEIDSNGKIQTIGITEWAAMAFERAGKIAPKAMRQAILNYDPDPSSATDLERHILALKAVYGNPHDQNGQDYVKQLYNNQLHDEQIGDAQYLNDDIFGVLALLSAGQNVNSTDIKQVIRNILAHQLADGSFSYSTSMTTGDTDTTAAALRALKLAHSKGSVVKTGDAVTAAREFLASVQRQDGGFAYDAATIDSNSATTAWVTLALNKPGDWKINKRQPWTYFSWAQQGDGSFAWVVGLDGDALTTAYVAKALADSLN